MSFLERSSYILHACAKGYQGHKSNFGFNVTSTAKSGKSRIKNPFWIRRKEHSQHTLSDPRNEVVEKKKLRVLGQCGVDVVVDGN